MNGTVEAAEPAKSRTGLRHGSLSLVETIGQSVASVCPTATPALLVAVIAGMAGVGTWLAYLIATIGMIFVAGNIAVLARRHPLAGSYFVYIGRTLGPLAGMTAGWSVIAAYLGTAIASVIGVHIALANILNAVELGAWVPPVWSSVLVSTALVGMLAYRDIRLSSRIGLILECTSLGIIVFITAIILIRRGTVIDPVQLDLSHFRFGGITSALAFAVFSFVGFESAATLAKEARDPARAVPRAVLLSAGIAGLFFVGITYAMMLAVGGDPKILSGSSSPFTEITTRAGLPWAAGFVYGAVLVSVFAAALACVNAASRLMFSMGRYEFIHRSMGTVHDRHQTPHVAIAAATGLVAIVSLAISDLPPLDAFGLPATFATFGFLVIYLLICVTAPLDLYRARMMQARHVVVGAIGVLLVAFVVLGSFVAAADYPYNLLPYLFGAYLMVGGLWYGILVGRAPGALVALQTDLEL
jgi:amino acid transporter